MIAAIIAIGFAGCGEKKPAKAADELTPFQIENGIGPVREKLTLAALDNAKAAEGGKIFEQKCFSCHRMDAKLVGPPLGEVLQRRTPEFVVNMIMNPDIMIQKHPVVKKMLAEHLQKMTYQNVSMEDAYKLLEYLRSVQKPTTK
jgi:cytochrome c